jgi:hypothetical protein
MLLRILAYNEPLPGMQSILLQLDRRAIALCAG